MVQLLTRLPLFNQLVRCSAEIVANIGHMPHLRLGFDSITNHFEVVVVIKYTITISIPLIHSNHIVQATVLCYQVVKLGDPLLLLESVTVKVLI
jgi:hypothetical protein